MLSWVQRRKFVVLAILFVFVLGVAIFLVLPQRVPNEFRLPIEKPSTLWTRLFELRDGFLDVAALVNNPNNLNAQKIFYSFKIYDKNNILIAIKEGETFAGPLEQFVIFEPNIFIGERTPGKVVLDLKDTIFSDDQIVAIPKIDILGTEKFIEDTFSRVSVKIKNRENKSLENIQSTIVVFGEDQNAIAVSSANIPFLGIDEERSINFTWPKALNGIFSTEVFFK
ncbi:MAG TPA: hypothetical protein VJH05_01525 [Candidatus Paceibacterota bacterium]